jgi:hypothetical protein
MVQLGSLPTARRASGSARRLQCRLRVKWLDAANAAVPCLEVLPVAHGAPILGSAVRRRRGDGEAVDRYRARRRVDELDAVYASGRLKLPFEGLLLFGY